MADIVKEDPVLHSVSWENDSLALPLWEETSALGSAGTSDVMKEPNKVTPLPKQTLVFFLLYLTSEVRRPT